MAPITPSGSVQKIDFARPIGKEPPRMAFGSRAPASEPVRRAQPGGFRETVRTAARELARHDMELESGPYADNDGIVGFLADEVGSLVEQKRGGIASREDVIQGVVDLTSPFQGAASAHIEPRIYRSEAFRFLLNPESVLSFDAPVSAGAILADEERRVPCENGEFIVLTNLMEPFFLATAVFRRLGFQAYPALASISDPGFAPYSPLMALLDPEDRMALRTVPLIGQHPPMDSVLLIGDDAMEGVAWSMLAQKRVKNLALDMIGSDPSRPPQNIGRQLSEISDILRECQAAWPGSPFIDTALQFLVDEATEVLCIIASAGLGHDTRLPIPQHMIDFIHPIARKRAEEYARSVAERVGQMPKNED